MCTLYMYNGVHMYTCMLYISKCEYLKMIAKYIIREIKYVTKISLLMSDI